MSNFVLDINQVYEVRAMGTVDQQAHVNTYMLRTSAGGEYDPTLTPLDARALLNAFISTWFVPTILPMMSALYFVDRWEMRKLQGVVDTGSPEQSRLKWTYDYFWIQDDENNLQGARDGDTMPTLNAFSMTLRGQSEYGIAVGGKRYGPPLESDTENVFGGNVIKTATMEILTPIANAHSGSYQANTPGAINVINFQQCIASKPWFLRAAGAIDKWAPYVVQADAKRVVSSQVSRKQRRFIE